MKDHGNLPKLTQHYVLPEYVADTKRGQLSLEIKQWDRREIIGILLLDCTMLHVRRNVPYCPRDYQVQALKLMPGATKLGIPVPDLVA